MPRISRNGRGRRDHHYRPARAARARRDAGAQGKLTPLFWLRLGIFVCGFAIVVLKVLPRFAHWFMKRAAAEEGMAEYMFVLASLFAAALLAQLVGIEPVIGAFLAGLALNPLLPEGQPLTNRLNFFSEAFFTPFFLFSVGMLVDLRVVAAGHQTAAITLGMIDCHRPPRQMAGREDHTGALRIPPRRHGRCSASRSHKRPRRWPLRSSAIR